MRSIARKAGAMKAVVLLLSVVITLGSVALVSDTTPIELVKSLSLYEAILYVVGTTTVVVFGYHYHLSYCRAGEAQVIWSWLPILGQAISLGDHPLELLKECAGKCREIFGLIVTGNRMFIITDPLSHKLILTRNENLTHIEFHHTVMVNFFGSSTKSLSSDVINSSVIKKYFSQYLFSDTGLLPLTRRMQTQLSSMIVSPSSNDKVVPMYDFLGTVVFKTALASIFNRTTADTPGLFSAFKVFDAFLPLACAGVDVSRIPSAKASRALLTKACLDACVQDLDGISDLMRNRWQQFMKMKEEDSTSTLSDPASFQLAILWASVGNTLPAAFWVMYFLLTHPKVLAEVEAEVQGVVGHHQEQEGKEKHQEHQDEEDNKVVALDFTQAELDQLTLLDACVTETLRLTSGSLIMRIAQTPFQLQLASGNRYTFRKGDRVGIAPPITHLDPDVFPDPDAFKPHRWFVGATSPEEVRKASLGNVPWLEKGGRGLKAAETFLPFGGGLAMCPGRRFARNEIKIVVVALLRSFELEVVGGGGRPRFDGSRAGLGVFPPKSEVRMSIKPKQ